MSHRREQVVAGERRLATREYHLGIIRPCRLVDRLAYQIGRQPRHLADVSSSHSAGTAPDTERWALRRECAARRAPPHGTTQPVQYELNLQGAQRPLHEY